MPCCIVSSKKFSSLTVPSFRLVFSKPFWQPDQLFFFICSACCIRFLYISCNRSFSDCWYDSNVRSERIFNTVSSAARFHNDPVNVVASLSRGRSISRSATKPANRRAKSILSSLPTTADIASIRAKRAAAGSGMSASASARNSFSHKRPSQTSFYEASGEDTY